MYQDIPKEEVGSSNLIYGQNLKEFKDILKRFIDEETIVNSEIGSTTNSIMFFVYR